MSKNIFIVVSLAIIGLVILGVYTAQMQELRIKLLEQKLGCALTTSDYDEHTCIVKVEHK